MATTHRPHRSVIAVVDDDERVLDSLGILLDSADYDVRLFSSAAALLESSVLPEIDCLISDVAMPVMDGFQLARAIQTVCAGLPIILITGRHDLLNGSTLDSPGQYRLFNKPFNGQELLTAVAEALARS